MTPVDTALVSRNPTIDHFVNNLTPEIHPVR